MSAEELTAAEEYARGLRASWREFAGGTALAVLLAEYDRRGAELAWQARQVAGREVEQQALRNALPMIEEARQQRAALLAACDQADQIPPDGELMGAVSTSRIRELLDATPNTLAPAATIDWARLATDIARDRGRLRAQVAAVRALAENTEKGQPESLRRIIGGHLPALLTTTDVLAALDGSAETGENLRTPERDAAFRENDTDPLGLTDEEYAAIALPTSGDYGPVPRPYVCDPHPPGAFEHEDVPLRRRAGEESS